MIYVVDNFLPKNLYKELLNYSDEFKKVEYPDVSFWVKTLPEEFSKYIKGRLEKMEGKKIKNILCFLREARESQDNKWRIHNDSAIENQQPDRAIVLYIKASEDSLNGTAFWKHKSHGYTYEESNTTEFNRMLLEDANDKSKWELNSVIGYKNNRLLSYPSEYFHSKYPNEYKNQRIVLVMFYKYE